VVQIVQEQRLLSTKETGGMEGHYIWEYSDAPLQRQMGEEPMGPYERQRTRLSGGSPNVYRYDSPIDVPL
jgi:hypothetical protein